jgi:hypothetical protein
MLCLWCWDTFMLVMLRYFYVLENDLWTTTCKYKSTYFPEKKLYLLTIFRSMWLVFNLSKQDIVKPSSFSASRSCIQKKMKKKDTHKVHEQQRVMGRHREGHPRHSPEKHKFQLSARRTHFTTQLTQTSIINWCKIRNMVIKKNEMKICFVDQLLIVWATWLFTQVNVCYKERDNT